MCQNMSGLSTAEVEFRKKAGLSNESVDSSTKTVAQIIRSNVVTYYNLIFLIITILLIVVGSFRDLTFLPIIIANMLIGIIQELRSKKILDDLTILNTPKITVRRNGSNQEVLADELVQDDVITLSAGGQIPADALVLSGNITVNEALITGEADEIVKKEGDSLFSGSFVISGECMAKLEKVGKDSYISGLMLQATQTKEGEQSEMIRALNRLVQTVGVIILPIGAILFLQQYFFSGATMKDSVTGMVAAILGMIPEGLYLLASVAMVVSVMRLGKQKVLIHDMKCIETLARVNVLCVDKTGTITTGEPKVTDVICNKGVTEKELISFAYALEKKSEHPLAKAVLAYAEAAQTDIFEVNNFTALPGNGLTAEYENAVLSGGNYKFISTRTAVSQEMQEQSQKLANAGKTPLFFTKDDKLLGIIAVADVIKEDSPEAVRQLQNMGIRVVMLTGDNERTAKAIGAQAGVDEVIADVLPDGKDSVISRLKRDGRVAMVGDGINDAPALTRADIGIAIGAGTDIAIDAADVVLMKSRLSDVPAAIRLSRATLRNIHENLFWAFFYNVVGIPLAAGLWYPIFGWKLNPMFGAAAMSLSSFCVVSNALRLNFFDIRRSDRDKKIKTKIHNNKEKESNMMEKTLKVEGMMCPHCEATVKKALEAIDGVSVAEADHVKGTATVTLTKDVPTEVLKKAIEDKDYKVIG